MNYYYMCGYINKFSEVISNINKQIIILILKNHDSFHGNNTINK